MADDDPADDEPEKTRSRLFQDSFDELTELNKKQIMRKGKKAFRYPTEDKMSKVPVDTKKIKRHKSYIRGAVKLESLCITKVMMFKSMKKAGESFKEEWGEFSKIIQETQTGRWVSGPQMAHGSLLSTWTIRKSDFSIVILAPQTFDKCQNFFL